MIVFLFTWYLREAVWEYRPERAIGEKSKMLILCQLIAFGELVTQKNLEIPKIIIFGEIRLFWIFGFWSGFYEFLQHFLTGLF